MLLWCMMVVVVVKQVQLLVMQPSLQVDLRVLSLVL